MRTNNTRKRRLLALLLSGMMVSSLSVAFAACNDDSSSSSPSDEPGSSTTQTQKDDGIVKNASFEIYNKNEGLNPIGTSVNNWTRKTNSPTSGSALTSKAASGIIDTTDEAWNNLTKSNYTEQQIAAWTETVAAEKWDSLTVKDKLAYYDAWKDNNDDDEKTISDLEFYQSFNIDSEDLPACENPRTWDYKKGQEVTKKTNTNVLMIHNEYSNTASTGYKKLGTAQKYESTSSVTVKAGKSAYFSVWVKTSNLESSSTDKTPQPAVDKGAYISITHTLGGNSLDPLMVKNINTEGVTDNNGWVQYTFYLQGSSYADATFTIVLGLGLGGGTDRSEYVNGYAFFDDIKCEIIDNETYADETGYDANNSVYAATTKAVYYDDDLDKKTVNTGDETLNYNVYAIDLSTTAAEVDSDILSNASDWKIAPTTEKASGGKQFTAAAGWESEGYTTYQGLGLDTSFDSYQVFANKTAINDKAVADKTANAENTYLETVYNKHFKDSTIIKDGMPVLMLLSADGAAYTAKSNKLTFSLEKDGYMAISFLVKTSALNGFTGANATLEDGDNKITISSIDTTTAEIVDVNKDKKDDNEGWVRCYFFVSNDAEDAKATSFSISLGYGPTTVMDTAKSSYYTGFAAFADFKTYTFTNKKAFDLANTGDYSKIVSLEGEKEEADGDDGFDTTAVLPTDAIETGFANPQNYKGVGSDSAYVGGGASVDVNKMATAGLLNKEHAANYTAILEKMGGAGATWDSVIGSESTQPLVIYNEGAQTNAYGFIGKEVSISANSYKAVAMRVKVSNGATAGVYLVDTSDETYSSTLAWKGQRVYWYDDHGNVCVKDPSKNSFNPTRDIAFKLQSNGLYKVNPNWKDASTVEADKYYANLSAYATDPDTKNKLLGEGAVSYNYNNQWEHDGNNGVAFYYNETDKQYYATSEKKASDVVLDFADVTALTPRYDTTKVVPKNLQYVITGDANEDWKTVIFYLHTGNESKTYRLEVWSGTRDGKTVNADKSYVMFDSYDIGGAESRFTSMIALRRETLEDLGEKLGETEKFYEGVYSFYDTDKFLRYNKALDENEVGNSYEDYKSSSYASGTAYLEYSDDNSFEMFVDYALSEQMPDADVEEDENDDEEEEEETPFDPASAWLLAGSILISGALVFAIGAVIVRKVIGKRRHSAPKQKKDKKD